MHVELNIKLSWAGPVCNSLADAFGKPIGLLRLRECTTADIRCSARKRIMQLLKAFRTGADEFGAMTFS
ncbi:hypothetical protein XH84_00385 [Bradyrhizobium nanningense]|nr:hypothetical protein XH84_00385 [Bradyrhizobium nanningense]